MASQVDLKDLGKDEPDTDKPKSGSSRAKSKRPAASAKSETDLRGRIGGMLDRIAESLETRGDDELAGIIREDAAVIATALVSLTRPFRALRTVVLAIVAIIEPALAFGRIGRALAYRWADRREARAQRIAAEADAAQREQRE